MIASAPIATDLLGEDKGDRRVHKRWATWLRDLVDAVNRTEQKKGAVTLTTQGASIAATDIPLSASLPEGLYRVSYTARITRAATTSSELTVTIRWTNAVLITQSGAVMNGNTTATVQTGSFLIRIDSATAIQYATTYASVGATSMLYQLDVVVEALP